MSEPNEELYESCGVTKKEVEQAVEPECSLCDDGWLKEKSPGIEGWPYLKIE